MKSLFISFLSLLPLSMQGQNLPENPITIGAGMQVIRLDGANMTAFYKTARFGLAVAKSRVLIAAELGYAQAQRRNASMFAEYAAPGPSTWSRYTADLTALVNVMPRASKHLFRIGGGVAVWAIADDVSTGVFRLPDTPGHTGFGHTRNHLSAIRTGGNVSAEYGYKLRENFHLELRLRTVKLKDGGVNPTAGVGISYLL